MTVLGTSLFVITRSAANRGRARLRRLREPRYWLGALAALAYLYFSLFRMRGAPPAPSAGRDASGPTEIVAAVTAAGPVITACLLALASAVAWVVPVGAGVLEFSRAEVQFLFPAPVGRQWLLVHSLVRSQMGLLLAALVPAVVFASGGVAARLRFAVSMWVVLVTLRLYFTGVSLARPRLNDGDRRSRWLARAPVVLSVGTAIAAAAVLVPQFMGRPIFQLDTLERLGRLGHAGAVSWLLLPFLAIVRPSFATDWRAYVTALPGALAALGFALLWVLQSDKAFDAAADAVVEGYDQQQSTLSRQRYRLRPSPWRLAPRGAAEGALVWKSATETTRLFKARAVLWLLLPFVPFTIVGSVAGAFPNGLAQLIAVAALMTAGFAAAMGPQIVRSDLRRDLVHLDVLKTWPIKPARLVRGAILWPTAQLTAVIWLGLVVGAVLSPSAFPEVAPVWHLASAMSALVLAPSLVAAQLVIHNGLALLFPAWVSLGGQRPRGLDATGQRLITLGGSWLALAFMAVPGAVTGAILWFLLAPWMGPLAMVPAACSSAAVLMLEALGLTELLGPLFDRLDLTDIERAE